MRRIKKLFSTLGLSVILLIFVLPFSACGNKDDNSGAENKDFQKELICDFESNKELLSIAYYNILGKVELCDDADYVKSGNYCAKVTTDIGKSPFKGKDANFTFVTGTSFITKTDFSDTVAFELDFFNAYKDPVQVRLTIDSENIIYDGVALPGVSHLVMPLNRQNLDLSSVTTIDFWFEGKPANEEASYEFYMDNFNAVTVDNNVYQKSIDYSGKTPFTFDNEYDVYNLMNFMRTGSESGESRFANPRFSLNRDINYILTGTGSLKAEFFSNEAETGIVGVGFRTIRGVEEMDWNKFDYTKTYVSCDVYNASDKDIVFGLALFTKINEVLKVDTLVKAKSWSNPLESRILLQDMLNIVTGTELDIMTMVFYVTGFTGDGDALYIDNISFKFADEF